MNRFEKVYDGNLDKISKEYIDKFKKKEKDINNNNTNNTTNNNSSNNNNANNTNSNNTTNNNTNGI